MEFSSVCRLCLSSESLLPIFYKRNDHHRYSTAVFITTGIKVDLNDGFPQNMCRSCINYLNDVLTFREKCRDTDAKLKETRREAENAKVEVSIALVDEVKMNLLKNVNKVDSEHATDKIIECSVLKTEHQYSVNVKDELVDHNTDAPIKNESKPDTSVDDNKPLSEYFKTEHSDDDTVSDNFVLFVHKQKRDGPNGKPKKEQKVNVKKKFIKVQHVEENAETNSEAVLFDKYVVSQTNKRVKCKLCQKSLSYRSVASHMACAHPGADDRRVKCEFCDKHIMKQKLNRHKILMHGVYEKDQNVKLFKCGYCKTQFETKESLIEHASACKGKSKKRKVNEKGREMTKCDVCQKSMQRASLRTHKAIKHAGLGPVCEHCGKMFGNSFRLQEHCRAKHGYEKFKCSYCEFQCAGVMALRVLTGHGCFDLCRIGREPTTRCHYCGSDRDFTQHMLEECPAWDTERSDLVAWIGHDLSPPAIVEAMLADRHSWKAVISFCEAVMPQKERGREPANPTLRNHERRHRGEKPFVCETCGAKFHAAYLLAQHKQSHRVEKLNKCNLCSASFKANNSLHMHRITCHGTCIYKCFLCDRTYTCRHYVVKHLRHFHDYKDKVGPLEKVYEVRNGDGVTVDKEFDDLEHLAR